MLTRNKPCTSDLLFRVPFGVVSPWIEYKEDYPLIETSMNGADETCTLCFYYSLNPLTNIYEFHDEDSENDIAECIGIHFDIIQNGEKDEEKQKRQEEEEKEEEEKQIKLQERSLIAFMFLQEEEHREAFIHSTLSIDQFIEYLIKATDDGTINKPYTPHFDPLSSLDYFDQNQEKEQDPTNEKVAKQQQLLHIQSLNSMASYDSLPSVQSKEDRKQEKKERRKAKLEQRNAIHEANLNANIDDDDDDVF